MLYIVSLLIALATLTAAVGISFLLGTRRRLSQRLEDIRGDSSDTVVPEELLEQQLPILLRLVGMFGWILPTQILSDGIRWELAQAGYRALQAPNVFVGARVLLTAGFALAGFIATTALHRVRGEVLLLTVVGAAIGYLAPIAFLRWRQAKRREQIMLALPDALDLMVICVEAGLGLNAALLNVGREVRRNSPALADELRMVNHEMRAGMSRVQALRNLAFRTGVDEVRALVAVLVQSDRFGTSIAQALRTHAHGLRIRRRQRAEEAARKTPVKMVFPLVFCIFPELLVVILAPGMLQLFRALLDMATG